MALTFVLAAVCGALCVSVEGGVAEAKSASRPLLTEHHAQSRLTRVPKVRRVQRARRLGPIGMLPRRWEHRGKAAHPRPFISGVARRTSEMIEVADGELFDSSGPLVEELEIESVIADLLLDDPAKRLLLPAVRVTEAPLAPPPEDARSAPPPVAIDRPSFAKRMIRMHPKLLDSGDDASSIA